jgi:hypothetical protein
MAFGTGLGQAGRRRGAIVETLNRDWDELVDRHRGSVRGWSRRHGALAECRSLADVLLAARDQPDAVLGALLTEVSTGDQLAARVVLQAMLGRIIRMAGADPAAGVDDYVSALWCRIRSYPGRAAQPDRRQPLDGRLQDRGSGAAVAARGRGDAVAAGRLLGRGA